MLRTVISLLVTVAVLTACRSSKSDEKLSPISYIDAEVDTSVANPTQFAAGDCHIFLYDHGLEKIFRWRDNGPVQSLGKRGDGPGEFRHIFAMAAHGDSSLVAVDWIRGRIIAFSVREGFKYESALVHSTARHAFVGPVIALSNRRILDAPWGGRATGLTVSAEVLDTAHLIYLVDSAGNSISAWGKPSDGGSGSNALTRVIETAGDLAVIGDTIVYLTFSGPSLQFFALNAASRHSFRHFDLPNLRTGGANINNHSSSNRRSSEIDMKASSLAISANGIIAVTLRMPDVPPNRRGRDEGPWPSEVLQLLRTDGSIIGRYRLDGRETRSSAFLRDGRYIRLYVADSTGSSGRRVGIYRIPTITDDKEARKCEK